MRECSQTKKTVESVGGGGGVGASGLVAFNVMRGERELSSAGWSLLDLVHL